MAKHILPVTLALGLSHLSTAVWAANQAPITQSHSETIISSGPHKSWVWAQDPNNDSLTYQVVTPPKYGQVKLDPKTGKFIYTPTSTVAYDEFSYQVSDGQLQSNQSSVQLNFESTDQASQPKSTNQPNNPNNNSPVVQGHAEQLTEYKLHNSRVWAKDDDNDPLTYQVVKQPKHGRLTLDPKTGKYSYQPTNPSATYDDFSYQVTDGSRQSNTATIQLTLAFGNSTANPVNNTPIPNNPTTNNPTTNPPTTENPIIPTTNTPKPTKPPVATNPTTSVKGDSYRSKQDFSNNVTEVLNSDFFTPNFQHNSPNRLADVTKAVIFLAQQNDIDDPDLDKLLYFLRAFNYYTPLSKVNASLRQNLEAALFQVSQMSELVKLKKSSAAVIEGYVVALAGLMRVADMQPQMDRHLPTIEKLLTFYAQDDLASERRFGDSVFQTLNLFDDLGLQAKHHKNEALKATLLASQVPQLINSLALSQTGMWNGKDPFVMFNAIEALGNLWLRDATNWNQQLDQMASNIVRHYNSYKDQEELKSNFYMYYVDKTRYYVRTESAQQACDTTFKNLCHIYQEEEVLPKQHVCSTTLKVRAQELSNDQLATICYELSNMETTFHQKMITGKQPVAEDKNKNLELVIFNSPEDWKKYGGILFKVSTDNGGIYIEGDPTKANNQARFYAYEVFRPDWQVWNLRHEYVHYLDGRFNQYGRFGHHPLDLTTWWAEGLAEYMAHEKNNERGLTYLVRLGNKNRPDMHAIAKTTYGDETMVYRWSYMMHRYLHENHPTEYLDLRRTLRQKDSSQYKANLLEMATRYNDLFIKWRDNVLTDWQQKKGITPTAADRQPVYHRPHKTAFVHRPLDKSSSLARPPMDN
ncbi:collagenase [Spartinivicinus poritis]|uniref:Collagenase n=1 Tax=Spartinivicinus poritis TaxID=2994640 RepID=A0ABT5UDC0_9GAMM|nr:collagenase [Spartinivicinus sp. A2-2]MDE1464373.1 collagenase [Spartinivicinus sp. A2-2]